jgi:hypothetical protein
MPSKPKSSPREPRAARRASRPAARRPAPRADAVPPQGLAGIASRDDIERMMAAELIAGHAAAMACYRGAATAESFAQRREYLNQAVRLSRAFVALVNALQRRRERAKKAAMPAEGARTAKSSKQPVAARGAPVSADVNSAKQPRAPLLAPDLPGPLAQAEGAAAVMLNAESAKQPSAARADLPGARRPPHGARRPPHGRHELRNRGITQMGRCASPRTGGAARRRPSRGRDRVGVIGARIRPLRDASRLSSPRKRGPSNPGARIGRDLSAAEYWMARFRGP